MSGSGNVSTFDVEMAGVLRCYFKAKLTVALSEAMDPEGRLNGAAINEMRNALDHLARVEAVRIGAGEVFEKEGLLRLSGDPDAYVKKHLDKCRGHIERARYDAYEISVLACDGAIKASVGEHYSNSDLVAAMPNYFSELLPKMNGAELLLAKAKMLKEAEADDGDHPEFEDAVAAMVEVRDEIQSRLPAVEEHHRRRVRLSLRNIIFTALTVSVLCPLLVLATWELSKLAIKKLKGPAAAVAPQTQPLPKESGRGPATAKPSSPPPRPTTP